MALTCCWRRDAWAKLDFIACSPSRWYLATTWELRSIQVYGIGVRSSERRGGAIRQTRQHSAPIRKAWWGITNGKGGVIHRIWENASEGAGMSKQWR